MVDEVITLLISYVGSDSKESPAMWEIWVQSLCWEDPLESGEGMANPLQYSCLENLSGQKNLVGYSLWGHKESDMTQWLGTQHVVSYSWYKEACIIVFQIFRLSLWIIKKEILHPYTKVGNVDKLSWFFSEG